MLHQVAAQLLQPGVERAPGGAGVGRGGQVVGQLGQRGQGLGMFVVLVAHHPDRPLHV